MIDLSLIALSFGIKSTHYLIIELNENEGLSPGVMRRIDALKESGQTIISSFVIDLT